MGEATLYEVLGAVDGDTIEVRVGATTEQVRLIGLDAPDLTDRECWAQMAANRMQALVRNRSVHLVRDPAQADRDGNGRLLRHVSTADGGLVAERLLEGGFARVRSSNGQFEHRATFRAAEERARLGLLGIWGLACALHPDRVEPAPGTSTGPGKSGQGAQSGQSGRGGRD